MSRQPHSIADHRLGADDAHDHGPDAFDHDHDHDFVDSAGSADPVRLISLGLDIGSSSTQIAFSRLLLGPADRRGSTMGQRDTLYLSPISPTPYDIDGSLDEQRLRRLVDNAFQQAGLTPDDVETGVVVLTGEAASRRNAIAVSQLLAEDVGDLVCAAAGHHMEAMLAAHGSGAVEASRKNGVQRILVVDIGGATTKFALIDTGRLLETAALSAGGRLVVLSRDNHITRFDPGAQAFASALDLPWAMGAAIDPALRTVFADAMAAAIVAAINGRSHQDNIAPLFLTAPLGDLGRIDGIMFAGGVGEYVYGRETRDFGDVGRALGAALRRHVEAGELPGPLLQPGECIRATVLGASQHSVQLSGHTIFISDHADLLPCRNVPVVRPIIDLGSEVVDPMAVAAAIGERLRAFDLDEPETRVALAFSWSGSPSYARLRALADGIAAGLRSRVEATTPFYVLVDGDLAQILGRIIKQELALASPVMVVDAIAVTDFDFVDIGRVRLPSNTVPVTVKSLLFGGKQP